MSFLVRRPGLGTHAAKKKKIPGIPHLGNPNSALNSVAFITHSLKMLFSSFTDLDVFLLIATIVVDKCF